MKKLLSVALCLVMLTTLFSVASIPASAASVDVVVWEGSIDMDFTTRNTIAIINSDDTLTQAIRDDIAVNGPALKYVLISDDSYYVGGPSGYVAWGFYQESPIEEYLECWSAKGSDINYATWTTAEGISGMNLETNLCLFSDGTGDEVYIGSIKLIATHEGGATEPSSFASTSTQTQPTTSSSGKTLVWEGWFDSRYTLDANRTVLYNGALSQAIHDDIATYGPVTQYSLTANGSYCYDGEFDASGQWGLYQADPFVECWADGTGTMNEAVWSDTYALSSLGNQTQLCIKSDGDSAYIGYIQLFAIHKVGPEPEEPSFATGTTGDCTWTRNDKELTISGVGAMADYGEVLAPWGTKIEKVNISAGVTGIGYRAFYACKSLTDITVAANNNTYASVDGVVFNKEKTKLMYCPEGKVGSYDIPDGVTTIEESAFLGCEKLTGVSIPSSVKEIGDSAFFGTALCNNIANYDITGMLIVDSWLLATLPERLPENCDIDEGIVGVAGGAFESCVSLKEVSIPNSVKYIGDFAFYGCGNLRRVDIPVGVETIGDGAFWHCTSLVTFMLSNSVKKVGYGVLFDTPIYSDITKWKNGILYIDSWMMAAESIRLPSACAVDEGTVGIADSAFSGCEYLESASLPSSIVYVGEAAFQDCPELGSVIIPSQVTRIEDKTFCGCKRLSSVTIPDGVTRIGDKAFYGCERLTGITLPAGLKTIGEYAFCGCNIDLLTIPNGVENIGKAAFYSCVSLRKVSIPDSVENIGEGAFSETAIYRESNNWELGVLYIDSWLIATKADILRGLYTIEEGTTKLANGAFFNCTELKIINIPSGVKNISDRAFSNCTGLTSVKIPVSVTEIGDCAFYGCGALEEVTFEGTKEGWKEILIRNGNEELLKPRFAFLNVTPDPTKTDPTKTDPTKTNPSETVFGDANGDGAVNMKDVLAVRKFLAGMDVSAFDQSAADANGDGAVNMKDVLAMRKYLAGLIPTLGA